MIGTIVIVATREEGIKQYKPEATAPMQKEWELQDFAQNAQVTVLENKVKFHKRVKM